MPYLSPRRTERALQRLADLAQQAHLVLEVTLCYGKVILIAYANPTDRIVPSRIVEPTSRTGKLVRQVAAEQRLPIDWLREDVRYYLAVFVARRRHDFDVFGPNLTLSVAEPAHVLAMKLHACECIRPADPQDLADVEFLVQKLGLVTWAAVASVYERFLPGCALGSDVRARVVEMFLPATRRLPLRQK